MTGAAKKIRLGISSCLLGYNVRYDKESKKNRYLIGSLGTFVEWFPFCPEFDSGLTVPREAMNLYKGLTTSRLMTIRLKADYTEQVLTCIRKKIIVFRKIRISGFIFKSKSPSCGLNKIKIYNNDDVPLYEAEGLFAKAFIEAFPGCPCEDDESLKDPVKMESFINKLKKKMN